MLGEVVACCGAGARVGEEGEERGLDMAGMAMPCKLGLASLVLL